MTLNERILNKLTEECILTDRVQVAEYANMRRQQILKNHIENVFPIKEPGERGGDPQKWLTKLTPHNRNHSGVIRANTREDLEAKILAFYLDIEAADKRTVRDILLKAVDDSSKTGHRTVQRFDKRLSSLSKIKVSQLNEKDIRNALNDVVASKVTQKEFNQTVTSLNKIADYCSYEHIEVCDIKRIIKDFRSVKLTGKHSFKESKKQTRNLYFSRTEASRIVRNALKHPDYKSLAVATLIVTGLRAGELLGLEVDDVYLDDDYLWIHQTEDTKTYELLDYVKENKSREVYLSAEAYKVVQACLEFRESDESNSPYLFLNRNAADGKMHIRALDNYLRTTIHSQILGLGKDREARSPHDCRRTYATLEYLNGTDIYDISHQLGHSKISQTEEYIKGIVDSQERKSRLKGTGILLNAVERNQAKEKEA